MRVFRDGGFWGRSFGKRPSEELYDIRKDPECVENLADKRELQSGKEALRDQLFRELREQGDPRVLGNGQIFDEYPYADVKTQRFYERYLSGELNERSADWVNRSGLERLGR